MLNGYPVSARGRLEKIDGTLVHALLGNGVVTCARQDVGSLFQAVLERQKPALAAARAMARQM